MEQTPLTPGQRRVLHAYLEALNQRVAALALDMSLRTFQWHMGKVHAALGTHSAAELVARASGHEYCCPE